MANYETINEFNATNPAELFQYVNQSTDYWFGVGVLISLFVISFLIMAKKGTEKAFSVSAFFTGIIAILFRTLELITDLWLVIFMSITILGFVALLFGRN